MRESGPRQPSNLDPIDRDTLAILGHRIERWDILKDETRSFEERKKILFDDLEAEINAINARIDDVEDEDEQETLDIQASELIEDQEILGSIEDTQAAFAAYADERAEYYADVRKEFLQRL